MRKLFPVFAALSGLMFLGAQSALAAPFNAINNPNIVANYDSGTHGIVGEPETHTGMDVVMQAGKSGNFQQWFVGTSSEDGFHGDHSVWKQTDSTSSKGNWIFINGTGWGDYLNGLNYLVHTNDFLNGLGL